MKTGDIIYFVAVAAGIAYNFYAKSKKKEKSDWEEILPQQPTKPTTPQSSRTIQNKANKTERQPLKNTKSSFTDSFASSEHKSLDKKPDAFTAPPKKTPLNKPKNRKPSNFLRKAVVYDTILNRPNY